MRVDAFCPVHGVRWSQYVSTWGTITLGTYARCGQLVDSETLAVCAIPVQLQWEPRVAGNEQP